jgi:hypothetical protein
VRPKVAGWVGVWQKSAVSLPIRFAIACLAGASLAAGCSKIGDGTVGSCVGSFSGRFEGDDAGDVTAIVIPVEEMMEMGTIVISFRSDMMPEMYFPTEGTVTSSGAVEARMGRYRVMGAINLDDCSAAGSWEIVGGMVGTWTADKI